MKLPSRLSGQLFKAMLALGEESAFRLRQRPAEKPKHWFRTWRFAIFVILVVGLSVASVRFASVVVALVCGGETFLVIGILFFRHFTLAARISGLITSEHQQGRYDHVRLTELGDIGATWILSSPAFRTDARGRSELKSTKRMRSLFSMIAKVLLALVILASAAALVDAVSHVPVERTSTFGYLIVALTYVTAIVFAVRFDIEQTPTMSALVGMLMPTFLRTTLEAQIAATIAFMVLQAGSSVGALYLIIQLFHAYQSSAYAMAGDLVMAVPTFSLVFEVLMAVVYFLIFFGIREGTIWLLWRWLCRRLRADPAELELAMRLKV